MVCHEELKLYNKLMNTRLKSGLNYTTQNEARGCQLYSYLLIPKLKNFKSKSKEKVTQQTQNDTQN